MQVTQIILICSEKERAHDGTCCIRLVMICSEKERARDGTCCIRLVMICSEKERARDGTCCISLVNPRGSRGHMSLPSPTRSCQVQARESAHS